MQLTQTAGQETGEGMVPVPAAGAGPSFREQAAGWVLMCGMERGLGNLLRQERMVGGWPDGEGERGRSREGDGPGRIVPRCTCSQGRIHCKGETI